MHTQLNTRIVTIMKTYIAKYNLHTYCYSYVVLSPMVNCVVMDSSKARQSMHLYT